MKCILYIASYKSNFFSNGGAEQEYLCMQTHSSKNHIVKYIDNNLENYSSLLEREGIKKIMQDIKTEEYQKMIIYSNIALGFNMSEIENFISELDKFKISIYINCFESHNNFNFCSLTCHLELNLYKSMNDNYYIFTGKKDDVSSLKYRGTVLYFEFIKYTLNGFGGNEDNYIELRKRPDFQQCYFYFSETILKNDISKIVENLNKIFKGDDRIPKGNMISLL